MTISDAICRYIDYKRDIGEKSRTIRYMLLSFASSVGKDRDLDGIKEDECSTYLNMKAIKSGQASSYWFSIYSAISGLYQWCFQRGYTSECPLPKWTPNEPEPFEAHIYTDDELRRIFDAALVYRKRFNIEYPIVIQTMLKVTCFLGLRPSETVNLYVNDIDIDNCLVTIRETKFYKSRLLTISESVSLLLRHYLLWRCETVEAEKINNPHLFIDKRGSYVKLSALQQAFRLICKKADVHKNNAGRSDVRLQDLRHTFATRRVVQWYKSGQNVQDLLPILSTYLGHCNLDSTSIYINHTPELLEDANKLFKIYAEL